MLCLFRFHTQTFRLKLLEIVLNTWGVLVTLKHSDLFKANFNPLNNYVKSLFLSWNCLPLSLMGRVNAIKMSVIPKFLYLSQCLPIFTFLWFCSVISFVWNNKSKRLSQNHLMKPKFLGGPKKIFKHIIGQQI